MHRQKQRKGNNEEDTVFDVGKRSAKKRQKRGDTTTTTVNTTTLSGMTQRRGVSLTKRRQEPENRRVWTHVLWHSRGACAPDVYVWGEMLSSRSTWRVRASVDHGESRECEHICDMWNVSTLPLAHIKYIEHQMKSPVVVLVGIGTNRIWTKVLAWTASIHMCEHVSTHRHTHVQRTSSKFVIKSKGSSNRAFAHGYASVYG